MRQVSIGLRSRFRLLLSVLLLALFLSVTAGISLAAPSTLAVLNIPAGLPEQQEGIPYCGIMPPEGCNKIQIVVMIDQSGSMPKNDPDKLRFLGAENLVNVLAYRYLEALAVQRDLQDLVQQGVLESEAAQYITPTIQLSVLHFGSAVFPQHNSGWITIAPENPTAWAEQFEVLKSKISPEGFRRGEATNFINPFSAAVDLFGKAGSQDNQGCPQRVILLLTDGAPAGKYVLVGKDLDTHMNRVADIAKEGMSGKGNFIYVTAFNVIGENYWREKMQIKWDGITKIPESADTPRSIDLVRSKQEKTAKDVAIRMEEIVAAHLGYQYQRFTVKAGQVVSTTDQAGREVSADKSFYVKDGQFVFPPFLQSVRITYFAPELPTAKFTMVDPDGKIVEPVGQDSLIQSLDVKDPKPGGYQITTTITGTVTLLPTYLQLTPKIETSSSKLQQFTSSEIQLAFLDTSGNPVTPADDPMYQLDFQAEIHQGKNAGVKFSWSEDGRSFKAPFLPVSSEPAQVEATATLQDTQGKVACKLPVDPGGELNIAPVTFKVGEPFDQVCAPSQMPVTYPLTLIISDTTQAPAFISVPVAWVVSSTSLSGHPVEASIDEAGAGQYQLSLRADQAESILTSLTASVEVEGKPYPFFTEVLTTTGLLDELSSNLSKLTPKIETPSGELQQFKSGEIQLTLLDTSGNPVTQADFPTGRLDLQAKVHQGDQSLPLPLSEDGSSFKAAFLPVSSGPTPVEVTATLRDTQGKEVCELLVVEPVGELDVAPVTIRVEEPLDQVCTPSQMPVTYPLTLINANTQAQAAISVPVEWEVSSSSLSGHPVASIDETGSGQYQLSLQTDKAEDIRTSLNARAKVEGQSYPFFTGVLATTGLLEERSLAFEIGKPGMVADSWSLFFNRLFKPAMKDYPGQILIGRRLFGWLGPQDVVISGRFFNQKTGEDETGIQRFFVQLAPEGGGPWLEKANGWIPGENGNDTLLIPAPRLGAYRLSVIDEGESAACTTIGGLPTLNLLLINDFWEYIFWIVLILLAVLLLAWLVLTLVFRYSNPPWGYLELVDPNGHVVWTGPFDSGDREHAVRSRYIWKLNPPIFGIVKIKAHSWDRPKRWVRIELQRADEHQVFDGYLRRASFIGWERTQWKDANLENDFQLTWWTGVPGVKKPPL